MLSVLLVSKWKLPACLRLSAIDIRYTFNLGCLPVYPSLSLPVCYQYVDEMRAMTNRLMLFLALLLYARADSLSTSDTTIPAPEPTHISSIIPTDPRPARLGFAPHFGQQTPWLRKRECLGNGTNFCFGDRSRFCPDCGGCCELRGEKWCCPDEGAACCPGERCCGTDERCCGRGCCPKGRRCSRGKCEVLV